MHSLSLKVIPFLLRLKILFKSFVVVVLLLLLFWGVGGKGELFAVS